MAHLRPLSILCRSQLPRTVFRSKGAIRHHASIAEQRPSIQVSTRIPRSAHPKPLLQQSSSQSLPHVNCVVRARIPTISGGEMFLHLYENSMDKKEHLAIVFGDSIRSKSLDQQLDKESEMDRMIRGAYKGTLYPGRHTSDMLEDTILGDGLPPLYEDAESAPLVRIHSECYTGETAWSARCDCGEQLDEAANLMSNSEKGGIIIYLRQEGRGIGLAEKLKAYNLQDLGSDTVEANLLLNHPADGRNYDVATAMLADLGQKDIRLLTNNPEKVRAIEGPNREIVVQERVPMVPLAWKTQGGIKSVEVERYLKTKVDKMSHMLTTPIMNHLKL
ncbi:hypothetical protein BP6252_04892 [Coleophoma cylindrospora]|uniref:GTP cyclohydrolase II n=1 Tax=Coleophoma cylindrospora TaxID=1849047 RepID=A0A3D8S2E7_9HELO|nr:hypothetical protein BP6252_04892 [Coleophoma cylindrospora]